MKKRIYGLLVLLGVVQGLTAQLISFGSVEQLEGGSDPIAIDGKEWHIRAGHYIYFSDIHMWIDGDTIVDGMACKKLYTHTCQLWEGGKEFVEVGYCRQDGDKYYQNGELMFDFSLQEGDKFTLNGHTTYSVIDTGHVVLKDGVSRRCLTVMDDATESSPNEYNSDVWIEGVGSLSMGVFSNDFVSAGLIKTLLDCSYNGQHIYYHDPIAMDGKEWYIREKIVHYIDYSSDVHMWIAGDTIVDEIYCKKLYIHTKQLWEGGEESLEVRYCHQDGEKYYQNGDLMYDFSLEVGDEFATYVDNEENKLLYTVVGVGDTVLLDGLSRKYLVMAPSYEGVIRSEETDIWVEGIGSLTQGIAQNDFYWSGGVTIELRNCSYNKQCIYEKVQAKPYLVTEGKQWAVERYTMGGVQGVYSYCLQGDTIINGKEYKIEYEGNGKDLSDMKPSGRYMREENSRVYSYVHTERYKDEDEVLFFDFNLEEGDTIVYVPDAYSLHVMDVYEAVVPHSDGQSRKCYEVELWNIREGEVYESDDFGGTFTEGIGNLFSGLSNPGFGLVGSNQRLLYVKQGDTMLYQREEEDSDPSRPITKRGYGLYHGDSYLYAYNIDESKEVTDSTDFARWYDKTVIYFDVDTIGPNAFSGATFRQGQVLYFTERLNTIFKDAFTDINIIKRTSQETLMSDDLTLVFAGANPPSIDKSHIMDYADSTYHINYVVPDLATYIASDIQWAYTSLITIDDFIRGYISPENEVTVNDSTEMDVEIDEDNTTMDGNVDLVVNARPRKDIPVRIGEGENKDIYSRAPAWMRYTVELKITDTDGTVLYTDSQQCSAYGECEFKATFARPANGIVLVYSRSIDQFGRATEWAVSAVNLDTSIDTMIAPDWTSIYYDLQGRPVTNPTRGIYIRNRHKIIL